VPLANDDRLLHVNAIASIQEDHKAAVTAMYTTGYRFSSWRVEMYIRRYLAKQSTTVRQRFRDFVQDATLSRDLMRDGLIYNQVDKIRRFKDRDGLVSLYLSIKDGLNRRIFLLPTDVTTVPGGHGPDPRPVIKSRVWTLFMWAAVECTYIEFAQKIIEEMTEFGIKPTIEEWNYLLYAQSTRGDIDAMINLIKKIRQDGIEPNLRSFSIVLAALYDKRRLEQARDVLKTVQSYTVPPEEVDTANSASGIRVAYNVAINGLLRNRRIPDANIILQKMQTEGPKPDIVTFNTFINRYTHMKDRAGVAATLRSMDEAGIKPDVYTYTILYVGASRNKDAKLKKGILQQMKATGVQANAIFLSAVINAVLATKSNNHIQTAMEILLKMEQSSNVLEHPTEVTYCDIISGIGGLVRDGTFTVDEGLEHAKIIYERMLKRGFRPNRVAYHLMMDLHLRHPDPESRRIAISYFDELKKTDFLNGDSWYILLHGLWKRKDFDLARQMALDLRMSRWESNESLLLLIDRIMKQ
jgi:pentatricopeptide repeat protein